MELTFGDAVAEASQHGCLALAQVDLREKLDLIAAIIEEHMQRRDMGQETTRMVTKSLSLTIMLSPFLLLVAMAWYSLHIDDGLNILRSVTSLADLNGDGNLDVIVERTRWEDWSSSWAAVKLWINPGGGQFTRGDQELPGGFAAAAGDLDGDGDADLLVLDGIQLTFLLNQGGAQGGKTGVFKYDDTIRPSYALHGHVDMGGSILLGDLNNDGASDAFIAGCCYGSSQTLSSANRLEPSFSWVVIMKWDPSEQRLARDVTSLRELDDLPIRAAALGDLNNDGNLDVFAAIGKPQVGGESSLASRVLLNDGLGNLTDSGQRLGNSDSTSVALGDMDGDGDLDALVGTRNGAVVWLNQGGVQGGKTGTLVLSKQKFADSETAAVFLADLNRDGNLDALIAGPEQADIWWNDGHGIFRLSDQHFRYTFRHGLAVGDFNGDGYPDIFAGTLEKEYTVWLNQRDGTFR